MACEMWFSKDFHTQVNSIYKFVQCLLLESIFSEENMNHPDKSRIEVAGSWYVRLQPVFENNAVDTI